MHATLVEYHRRFPDVDVHAVDGGHDRLLCALAGNTIDVAIMTTCHPGWDDRALPLWSERGWTRGDGMDRPLGRDEWW
jgi:hypothetical protein